MIEITRTMAEETAYEIMDLCRSMGFACDTVIRPSPLSPDTWTTATNNKKAEIAIRRTKTCPDMFTMLSQTLNGEKIELTLQTLEGGLHKIITLMRQD